MTKKAESKPADPVVEAPVAEEPKAEEPKAEAKPGVFDAEAPFGTVHGPGPGRFYQNGVTFDGNYKPVEV